MELILWKSSSVHKQVTQRAQTKGVLICEDKNILIYDPKHSDIWSPPSSCTDLPVKQWTMFKTLLYFGCWKSRFVSEDMGIVINDWLQKIDIILLFIAI